MAVRSNAGIGAAAPALAMLFAAGCASLEGAVPAQEIFAVVEIYNMTDATLKVELREDKTATPLSEPVEILSCGKSVVPMNAPPPRTLRAHAIADKVEGAAVHGVSWPVTATGDGARIDLGPVDFGAFLLMDAGAAFDLGESCRWGNE